MAKGVKPCVKVPKSASAGEAITIKTLISRKMESGRRKDSDGNTIPRSIINRFIMCFQWYLNFRCHPRTSDIY